MYYDVAVKHASHVAMGTRSPCLNQRLTFFHFYSFFSPLLYILLFLSFFLSFFLVLLLSFFLSFFLSFSSSFIFLSHFFLSSFISFFLVLLFSFPLPFLSLFLVWIYPTTPLWAVCDIRSPFSSRVQQLYQGKE